MLTWCKCVNYGILAECVHQEKRDGLKTIPSHCKPAWCISAKAEMYQDLPGHSGMPWRWGVPVLWDEGCQCTSLSETRCVWPKWRCSGPKESDVTKVTYDISLASYHHCWPASLSWASHRDFEMACIPFTFRYTLMKHSCRKIYTCFAVPKIDNACCVILFWTTWHSCQLLAFQLKVGLEWQLGTVMAFRTWSECFAHPATQQGGSILVSVQEYNHGSCDSAALKLVPCHSLCTWAPYLLRLYFH